MSKSETFFWKDKSIEEMNIKEWESLCDRCGRCCVRKLENTDTGDIFYTNVSCSLLDIGNCNCLDYENRKRIMPDCLSILPHNIKDYKWLPLTCAYRLLSEGKALKWWHPLLTGNPETVHEAGISVRNRLVSEDLVLSGQIEDHIVEWDVFEF